MANENFGSTVLHEHRKVVTLRHLLALVNFIAIFASTLVTRHFVLIRGTSDGIMLIINLLCAVNIVQIILCIVDYITKVLMGKYFNKLTIASYIVGVVWFGMVVAEFISGSVNLGDVRVDLGIIAILQLASALIAYIVWPHIDYATIRKMTHKNVRENPTKRAKKATGGVVKYVLVCVLMLVVQFGMLLAYKLPPNVYDLFSESRQLQYTLSEDGESYEVIGVYVGTSTYVNVPATYNNKPVTKIREGALSNASFLEINKITKIDFGSPAVDDDGNDIIVSNVNTIEKGAIVNDKITTLTLPSSVTRIDNGAIKSASLKKLVYEAQAQFSYPYLDCSSLATITFSGLEAGKIVSLEGMDSSVTLEVPKDTYNNYREKNNEYMASIRPILESNEYVIDFYTDSDYYIESIFAFSGEVVELGYNDLKNDKYDDKTAPSVDTLSYLKDKHELGTNGAKADSAFRGWYYDRNFTDEVDFSSGKITISDNTAIYAKWIDEYTGTLDWGTYHPDGQPNTLYWTDEDLVSFPVIDGREGFKNGIVWTVNGSTATSSQNISESVTVKGTWVFDKPTVDINPYPQNSDDKSFAISTDKNTVSFVYDETQKAIFEGIMTHVFDGKNGFSYSTEWYRTDSSNIFDVNKTTSVQNVAESGTYILKVTAISPYGDRSVAETQIDVVIDRKELNIGSCALKNDTVEYNSWNQTLTIEGTPVHDKIEFTYNY